MAQITHLAISPNSHKAILDLLGESSEDGCQRGIIAITDR